MNTDTEIFEKAETLERETDLNNVVDCMVMVDFFNSQMKGTKENLPLLQKVHKIIGKKVVEAINKWQNTPTFEVFLGINKGELPTTKDYDKCKGDVILCGENIGVIKEVREGTTDKIFIVHTTDGQEIPIRAVQK